MLGWELPPYNSGGLGVACLGLAKSLSKKGARITFVLPKKVDVDYDFMDIVFAEIDDDSLLMKNSYTTFTPSLLTSEFLDPFPPDYLHAAIKFAEKMKKLASRISTDVIHVHDWMTYPAGIVAKKITGKPLVVHIHNTVFDRGAGSYNPYEYNIEKKGFEMADKIISVSNFTKNKLTDEYKIDAKKINVVYNGVEEQTRRDLPPALTPLKELGYKIVLYLGRITLQKGVDYLIRSAKKVLEVNPKVIFVIVGSGDMQEQMMSLAASLGILDKVIFTGFLRGDDRTRIFQAADLCVMPSVSEPFGIVSLEAVAYGTPVLVSKQSGVSEVLDHALKVDFWDVDEMTNKILSVCQYPALCSDLRDESAKELPNVNWDNAADKCIGVYKQLIH
jgi:glycogen(starch) synthase